MVKVTELVVQSPMAGVRVLAAGILLQFLITYPLGEKRLKQHLDAILANLSYEHATGRCAILELLHALFNRFPHEFVTEKATYFFAPLVLVLANDDNAECRALCSQVVKRLLAVITPTALASLFQLTVKWFAPDAPQIELRTVAAQLLGLFFETHFEAVSKHLGEIFDLLRVHLDQQFVEIDELALSKARFEFESEQEEREFSDNVPWKLVYYSVVALEKLAASHPASLAVLFRTFPLCAWYRFHLILVSHLVGVV